MQKFYNSEESKRKFELLENQNKRYPFVYKPYERMVLFLERTNQRNYCFCVAQLAKQKRGLPTLLAHHVQNGIRTQSNPTNIFNC